MVQPGLDFNFDAASGARLTGTPTIQDYAFFLSATYNPTARISIRPGVRLLKNSVYKAPPAVPSLNARLALTPRLDLRLAYARGFRSPALRELYFNFVDASHAIRGNPGLKAEHSNSFNGSLVWQFSPYLTSTLGAFYNQFFNLISYGMDAEHPGQTTYLNISRFRTLGATLDNTLHWKRWRATLGFSYIGRYNNLLTETDTVRYANALPLVMWSPEVNANLTYTLPRYKTQLSWFYKFSGKRPAYLAGVATDGQATARLTEMAAYHWADLTLTQPLGRQLLLTTGVKNLFNVTRLANTSSGGTQPTTAAGRPR